MNTIPEKLPDDMAIWRFGVISPLLHRHPEGNSLSEELQCIAAKTFLLPNGQQRRFSSDTLRHWLYRYRKDGLAGLKDKVPKNHGRTFISLAMQDAIAKYRKQHPRWTTKRLMNLLKEENQWNGHSPSPTAIYRFCKANGLKRNPEKMATPVRSFEYPHFGDMWMADFMHGPQVRHKGKDKKAILHAIIDDATRTIVAARFHLSEDTRALISDLMIAVQRFGIPKRFYTDNGSAFRSNHLAHVGAKLSMSLPHTPPYLPQGRGKIERFFRTLRDGFITGRPRTSLDTLNQELEQWIAHYHAREHTSLNMSPLNKRMSVPSVTKVLDNVRNVDALFRMEVHKKVYSDGCIRLHGRLYDVPEALPHQKIKVSYLPWDLSVIYLGEEMLPAKVLDKTKNATRYENPKQGRKS